MTPRAPVPPLKRYPMPFTRLEIALLAVVGEQMQVLLVQRAEEPYAGYWALPGGVLRIDMDASLEEGARRVAHERLKLAPPFLRQLCAVGGAARDPRGPWALSVVYRALVRPELIEPVAGKRIQALAWRPVNTLCSDRGLAFDHAELVAKAVATTRSEVERMDIPFAMLPERFTLGELQSMCEKVLGRRLDKSSFRRKLDDRDLVEPVPGETRGGAYRPAQIYAAKHIREAPL